MKKIKLLKGLLVILITAFVLLMLFLLFIILVRCSCYNETLALWLDTKWYDCIGESKDIATGLLWFYSIIAFGVLLTAILLRVLIVYLKKK